MLDKRAFLRTVPPFDRLDDAALKPILEVLSSERFTAGEHILRRWDNPSYLYIVTQGDVEELDSEGTVGRYSSGSVFDARGLIEGRCQHTFIARSVVRCYRLPAQPFLSLIRNNSTLGDYFYEEITRKLDALITVQQQREATSFMLARIGDGELRPPVFADSTTSIQQAVALMQAHHTSAIFVKRGDDIGIFTSRDVREQLMLARKPESTPISEIAKYQLISLGPDDLLFNALVVMTQHAIRHVVIRHGGTILGVLEQIDLLNTLSSHSQLVSTQIDHANSQQALQEASERIPLVIKSLYERGVKTRYISRLVTDLNRRLFRRLYELILPAALADNACLVVMGSEGRGEQLMRTDQDNALILKDPFLPDQLAALTSAFTGGLVALGYPRCPGNIMVSNPDWAKTLADYKNVLFRWVVRPDQNAFMNLAIFLMPRWRPATLTFYKKL
ncbi:MAG: cyclic nucleotide-binding domain-containing protein, partial [Candidatus Competibacteraceae bacterium]|nr:cyclic nucleotide-binding domain-containing protein [Candidatus Competibacteraceae bacterium]